MVKTADNVADRGGVPEGGYRRGSPDGEIGVDAQVEWRKPGVFTVGCGEAGPVDWQFTFVRGAVLVFTLNATWVTICAAVVLGPSAGAPSRPHLGAGASSRRPICTARESCE